MIANAIIQDGGVFIPNLGKQFGFSHGYVTIQVTFLDIQHASPDPFQRAAGILKEKPIDPLRFERELRYEWDR